MALMMGNLYSALKLAGADEEHARAAAEEAYQAYNRRRPSLTPASGQLVWMAAVNLALTFVLFVMVVLLGR